MVVFFENSDSPLAALFLDPRFLGRPQDVPGQVNSVPTRVNKPTPGVGGLRHLGLVDRSTGPGRHAKYWQ